MSTTSRILYVIAIVILLVVGYHFFNRQGTPAPDTTSTSEAGTVLWCLTDPDETENCYPSVSFLEGMSAYDTFALLAQREENLSFEVTDYGEEFGMFITQINGKPEEGEDFFWKFFVNEAESLMGISSVSATDGDRYDLKYEAIIF